MSSDAAPGIRPATSADASAVATLAARTFTETFGHLYPANDLRTFLASWKTETNYAQLITDPEVFVALATADEGRPVGYVVAGGCKLPVDDLEPAAGEVRELYVLGSHQGRRLGTRLLETALDWLAEGGRSPLYVGVWSENDGAQRLYGRYGFDKVGEYDFPVGEQRDREFILKQVE
ncbi:MAG: GNAT family N-acetyltransferase [Gemmatimonadota bacterium]|jgi:ribosomal protein S18 acetylase RimI-like enzyme